MIRTYDIEELEAKDTIESGHSQDLKVDGGYFRVWLDRTGEDVPVQYEVCIDGRWYSAEETEDGHVTVTL